MHLNVGSKNEGKISAVTQAVILYPALFPNPVVTGVEVKVDLFGHPKSITDTVNGAVNRAKNAFIDCEYSFGIEGGLMAVPYTLTGFMEVGACAIYDGTDIYIGLSPAFEFPKKVTEMILLGQADASLAFKKLRLTMEEKIGATGGGIISFLTNQKVTREDLTKFSIMMALARLENPEMYK